MKRDRRSQCGMVLLGQHGTKEAEEADLQFQIDGLRGFHKSGLRGVRLLNMADPRKELRDNERFMEAFRALGE